jgi:hypothetical protein
MYFFNWTPLQNEEKLSFRIVSDGVFASANDPQRSHLYSLQGHQYSKENIIDIFYFGEPICESNSILFDPTKIAQKGNKGRLNLSFGGKFSPRKTCEYELDLSNINVKEPNDIIKIKNKLTKDLHDEKGVTKEFIIKTIMEK